MARWELFYDAVDCFRNKNLDWELDDIRIGLLKPQAPVDLTQPRLEKGLDSFILSHEKMTGRKVTTSTSVFTSMPILMASADPVTFSQMVGCAAIQGYVLFTAVPDKTRIYGLGIAVYMPKIIMIPRNGHRYAAGAMFEIPT